MPQAVEGGVLKPEILLGFGDHSRGQSWCFFLLTAGLIGGFANLLIPLQIGARDMAFPFLNMLSYWVFLLSCIVLIASFLVPRWSSGRRLDYVSATKFPSRETLPGSGLGDDFCGSFQWQSSSLQTTMGFF
jgi:cytochrome c oxidase subunit 1